MLTVNAGGIFDVDEIFLWLRNKNACIKANKNNGARNDTFIIHDGAFVMHLFSHLLIYSSFLIHHWMCCFKPCVLNAHCLRPTCRQQGKHPQAFVTSFSVFSVLFITERLIISKSKTDDFIMHMWIIRPSVGSSTEWGSALHQQLQFFITMEINSNVHRVLFSEFIYCFPVAGFPQIWWKICTHSIFYASVIWEPSDKHKLEKCMMKATFIKAKIIMPQSAHGDLKHNFHLPHILHFSPLSLSVPVSPSSRDNH